MPNFNQEIDRRNTNSIKWNRVQEDVLPMWVADMEFASPAVVREALINRVEHGILGYTTEGTDYYQAIINWMDKRHNWAVKEDWICNSPGIVSGISMLLRALTEPRDKVVLQTPVYFSFFPMIKNNDREILKNELKFDGERYTMDFADLEEKFAAGAEVLILCSPHNPVGRVWTTEELKKLGELCFRYDVTVISDEIHSDLILPGHDHTVFASLGEEFRKNSVVCTSPSKTFNLPGLQPGNIIIPDQKLRNLYQQEVKANNLTHPNVFTLEAVKAAYKQGEPWLEELLDYLTANLDFLKRYLADNIPQIKVIEPEGTYLVWLDFRSLGVNEEKLDQILQEEAQVALTSGSDFGAAGLGFQRINIACPRSMLREALQRLKEAISK